MSLNLLYVTVLTIWAFAEAFRIIHTDFLVGLLITILMSITYAIAICRRQNPSLVHYAKSIVHLELIFMAGQAAAILLIYLREPETRSGWLFGVVASVWTIAVSCLSFTLAYAFPVLLKRKSTVA